MPFPFLTAVAITSAFALSTGVYQVTTQVSPQATQIAQAFLSNLERKNVIELE